MLWKHKYFFIYLAKKKKKSLILSLRLLYNSSVLITFRFLGFKKTILIQSQCSVLLRKRK